MRTTGRDTSAVPAPLGSQYLDIGILKSAAGVGGGNQSDRIQAGQNLGCWHFTMRNRLFVAILTLLLCAITARADKPTVIKDSEAIQYVGKEVAVYGQVVSVTTSPLGTAFINFGGEYSDNIRWVHCGRVPHGERSATHYDLRENHKHPWHNPTSGR